MEQSLSKILEGYHSFREKYARGDAPIMEKLSFHGQKPKLMIVACCDSRVDPALILQCDPGDLFVVRNVANIVPPYEKDAAHHGTSAALEFGIRFLNVKHLILWGHSQCGGIEALFHHMKGSSSHQNDNDFITPWVSVVKNADHLKHCNEVDDLAKLALNESYSNCLTFPWISEKINNDQLQVHLWFFDVKSGKIFMYCEKDKVYKPLD